VLDQVVTDFIIETCYEAESHARYANRLKLKVDDFQFALRRDSKKLGRVQELLDTERDLKNKRKVFDHEEGKLGKDEEKAHKRAKKNKGGKEGAGKVKSIKNVPVEDDLDLDLDDD